MQIGTSERQPHGELPTDVIAGRILVMTVDRGEKNPFTPKISDEPLRRRPNEVQAAMQRAVERITQLAEESR